MMILYSWGQTACSQGIDQVSDSVYLKVTKARSTTDRTYYWLKDIRTKEKYYTVCSCKQIHKKGDVVPVAKNDLEFIPGKILFY